MSKLSRRAARRNAAALVALEQSFVNAATILNPITKENTIVPKNTVATIPAARGSYAKVAKRDAKGRILPKNGAKKSYIQQILESDPITPASPTMQNGQEGLTFDIQKLKKGGWVTVATISTTKKGRPLTSENDAVRYGRGVFGTRPRNGEATSSKSGKRFRAVKV